jgi:hypothetical protein
MRSNLTGAGSPVLLVTEIFALTDGKDDVSTWVMCTWSSPGFWAWAGEGGAEKIARAADTMRKGKRFLSQSVLHLFSRQISSVFPMLSVSKKWAIIRPTIDG